MENILITGGTGFLGSKIVQLLLKNKYKVFLFARPSSNLFRLQKNINNKNLNIIYVKDLNSIFEYGKISHIIHTATCYGRDNENIKEIMDANYFLPLMLLEKGIDNGLCSFINADTFFNTAIKFTHNEGAYVKTKKDFSNLAISKVKNTNTRFVNLKIEQMYGPGDSSKKFIPSVINDLKTKEKICFTSGYQRRDFVYVDDVANSFLQTVKNIKNCANVEEFGVGTGLSLSIREVLNKLKIVLNSHAELKWGVLPLRKNEIIDSKADLTNNNKIGWKSKINVDQGFLLITNSISN